MSLPRRPQPTSASPQRDRRRTEYPNSQRRRRTSDVESWLHESPSQPGSPTKKSVREPATRALPSPGIRASEKDPMMAVSPSRRSNNLTRKRSLIRPERNKINESHPNYHYRQHAYNMEVRPSTTGNDHVIQEGGENESASSQSSDFKNYVQSEDKYDDLSPVELRSSRMKHRPPLARDESGRHPTILTRKETRQLAAEEAKRQKERDSARVPSFWSTYCHLITFWCPDAILRCLGKPAKAQQRAWREKMGLISIILLICAFVGYLTFGFTATVCPNGGDVRLQVNNVGLGYLIIHGQAYDLSRSQHPYARGIPDGANVLFDLPEKDGGQDASFLFQNVNGNCKGLITAANGSDVPTDNSGNLAWYFPCTTFNQDESSSPNAPMTSYYLGYGCHLSTAARNSYYDLHASSDVYFTWADIKNSTRNLVVYGGDVMDLDLLEWLNTTQVLYPARFDQIRTNPNVKGVDLTLAFASGEDRQIAKCFSDIIKVGSIDTQSIGCIASKVVLYVSLVFILSIVMVKFLLALLFQWFLSKRYAAMKTAHGASSKARNQQIEDWTDEIYCPQPNFEEPFGSAFSERSRRTSAFLPQTSRFSNPNILDRTMARARPKFTTMASQSSTTRLIPSTPMSSELNLSTYNRDSRTSLVMSDKSDQRFSSVMTSTEGPGPAGFIHDAVVPQPPQEWQPFGYPLAHAICLVTAYSEGADSLRTTLDSVATTDYPNSHKIILVVCDGLIKGKGEDFSTPEIVLGMMSDYTILPNEVQTFSYVAVASGSKRHNMAKIYSGFYDYGEKSRIRHDNQQRVPMMVVVKCGTPDEATKSKPGNRGKRDSQIILMSFLQKVMFDERMTELEFEMFNGIWKITGISPDFYEMVLMVDADTKIFPDSLTHMVSAMVKDPEIMGLCGETKIANKRKSWVSMIQVFEYFVSHHLAKSFESVFGGVTCLPGCFSMYRIKAPKGGQNYWVPILANPDIVEHYSENVVDTLHKKNLLLLGEDRYLSTLMLKTFPKRKQVFVPQAVCKTTVPEEFRVLLSQRRRWINSTIHNLMELVLVKDLCGTFCFSMQFVIFIELVGTLVLPAAISFTIYLIIKSIIAAINHTVIPVIPLVLLALILGLPAILIVLTAHRFSYVFWMLIYLISLPIWNGILPLYAYWKFDDFSWGDTRKTAGEKTKKAGLEYEGEFDSSKITMKKWSDFEQEKRLKETTSRGWSRPNTSVPSFAPSAWQARYSQADFERRNSYHD